MIQMTVAFVILSCMISTVESRFDLYKPFSEELNSNGWYYYIDHANNPLTNKPLDTSEELAGLIEGENSILAMFTLWIDKYENHEIEAISYEKQLIQKYTPEIQNGQWFDLSRKDSDIVQVVVSQNDFGFQIGDVITLYDFSKTPIKAEVIGILKDNTKIIGRQELSNMTLDCRSFYRNYSYEVEEKPVFIFLQEELNYLDHIYESQGRRVGKQLNGSLVVTYSNDISGEKIENNNSIIEKMMAINVVPLTDIKENSLDYIFFELYKLLPIYICVFIFSVVGLISISALAAKQQMKTYAIYYICGLEWKKCAIINCWSSVICVSISLLVCDFFIGAMRLFGFWEDTVVNISPYQMLACLLIGVLYIVISIVIPLKLIGNSSANNVLKTN